MFASRKQIPKKRCAPRKHRTLAIEPLEERRLLAIDSSFSQGLLKVSSDWDDPITVTEQKGLVKINGADPVSGPVLANLVTHIDVTGGPMGGIVQLSGVDMEAFSSLEGTSIKRTWRLEAMDEVLSRVSTRSLVQYGLSFMGPREEVLNSNEMSTLSQLVRPEWRSIDLSTFTDEQVSDARAKLKESGRSLPALEELLKDGALKGDALTNFVSYFGGALRAGPESLRTASAIINGDSGNNNLVGTSGPDTIDGGEGNDTIWGMGGIDTIDGGEGNDVIYGDFASGIDGVVEKPHAGQTAGGDNIDGGEGTDTIYGEDGIDEIYGGSDNDKIDGGADNDEIYGGSGADTLDGGAGDNTLTGNSGNDRYVFSGTVGLGTNSIVELASGGTDTLDFSNLNFGAGVTADLRSTSSAYLAISHNSKQLTLNLSGASNQLEGIVGTQYDDMLIGNSSANQLVGNGGHDVLTGLTGVDGYGLPKVNDSAGDRTNEDVYERIDLGVPWQIDATEPVGTASSQAVAVDGLGNSVHIWLTTAAIVGRRFDAAGTAIGNVFTVVETAGALRPRISTGLSGDFVVAWEVEAGANHNVFFRRYRPLATDVVAGDVVQVASGGQTTANKNPSVVLRDDGTVTVVWEAVVSPSGTNADIYLQQFDADDEPLSVNPVIVFGSTITGDQRLGASGRAIALDADGDFAVSWIDGRQILVRRFNSDGSAAGSNETVLATADTATGTTVGDASVTFGATGDLLVTWWQKVPGSPATDKIMQRRYDTISESWKTSLDLVDFSASFWTDLASGWYGPAVNVTDLQVATDGWGHLGVAWTHFDAAGANWSYVEWFSTLGVPITAPMRLNATATYEAAKGSSIAGNANGRFLATWNTSQSFVSQPVDFAWAPTATVAPPRLVEPPVQVVAVGDTLDDLNIVAIYPGGTLADVRIEASSVNPDGVSIAMSQTEPWTATLDWDPPQGAAEGVYLINVDVRDVNNSSARTRAVIRVAYGAPNVAPVLENVADQTVIVGQMLAFQLVATDSDGPSFNLRYSLTGGAVPTGANFNQVTGAFSWTPTAQDVGAHSFNLVVTDRGTPSLPDSQPITITVLAANVAPTFTGPTSVSLNEDGSFVFTSGNAIGVADSDNGSSDELELAIVASHGTIVLGSTSGLEYSIGDSMNVPSTILKFRGTEAELTTALNGLTFEPDDNFYGTAELRLELNDLGNGGSHPAVSATRTISLAVTAVSDSPSIAAQTLNLNDTTQDALIGYVAATNPDRAIAS